MPARGRYACSMEIQDLPTAAPPIDDLDRELWSMPERITFEQAVDLADRLRDAGRLGGDELGILLELLPGDLTEQQIERLTDGPA